MKSFVRAAIVATLLGSVAGVAVVTSSGAAFAEEKVGAKVGKALNEALKDMQANDSAGALAAIKEAQAVDNLTPYEQYKINSILAYVTIQTKDYATATTATEAAADSPAMPDSEKSSTLHNAILLAVPAKHYDKAIVYGQQLLALNGLDATTDAMLARAYYFTKDKANAGKFAQMSLDASKAAGQPPDEGALEITAAVSQNSGAGGQQTLESLAVEYNQPEAWNRLIETVLGGKAFRDADTIYLLRLKMLMPETLLSEDYTSLASAADLQGYSTEAYATLQKGIAAGKITAAQTGPTFAHAKNGAAMDQRDLPSIVASAEKSKTGQQDIKLAEDYWGYSRFADAETVTRRAIAKGGLKDPSEGPLLLGMLLAAQGKYDDAIQTLSTVNGSASRASIVHLWTLYAQAMKKKAAGGATQH